MKISKSKILALAVLCITANSIQAMEDEDLLVAFTNKTPQKAKVQIKGTGSGNNELIKGLIGTYDVEPGKTFSLKKSHLTLELRNAPYGVLIYQGWAKFEGNQKLVEWFTYREENITFTVDKDSGSYNVEYEHKYKNDLTNF